MRTNIVRLPSVLLISGLLGTCLLGCQSPTTEQVETEASVPVTTAVATTGDIRGVIHAAGIVVAAPGAEMIVHAPEAAMIAAIPHAEGERVSRGDVLVRFDLPNQVADVQRQDAELVRAEAAIEAARAAQSRAKDLFERGIAARREVEDTAKGLADAEAAHAQVVAAKTAAGVVAGRAVVMAPFAGVVVKRYHNQGDQVDAAAGDPVLQLVDTTRLEVSAAVPLSDVVRLKAGAQAKLSGLPSPILGLTVLAPPAAVDAAAPTASVRLRPGRALPLPLGLPVQVEIEAEARRAVVLVPVAAIVRDIQEAAVFIVRNGKAERQVVTLGLTDGALVEIREGVAAGDRLIVAGQSGLPDGARVRVADTAPPTPQAKSEPTEAGQTKAVQAKAGP